MPYLDSNALYQFNRAAKFAVRRIIRNFLQQEVREHDYRNRAVQAATANYQGTGSTNLPEYSTKVQGHAGPYPKVLHLVAGWRDGWRYLSVEIQRRCRTALYTRVEEFCDARSTGRMHLSPTANALSSSIISRTKFSRTTSTLKAAV